MPADDPGGPADEARQGADAGARLGARGHRLRRRRQHPEAARRRGARQPRAPPHPGAPARVAPRAHHVLHPAPRLAARRDGLRGVLLRPPPPRRPRGRRPPPRGAPRRRARRAREGAHPAALGGRRAHPGAALQRRAGDPEDHGGGRRAPPRAHRAAGGGLADAHHAARAPAGRRAQRRRDARRVRGDAPLPHQRDGRPQAHPLARRGDVRAPGAEPRPFPEAAPLSEGGAHLLISVPDLCSLPTPPSPPRRSAASCRSCTCRARRRAPCPRR